MNGIGVRLASDPVGKVARLYGVYKADENLAFSAFYLIDPEGNIIAMEKCDFPVSIKNVRRFCELKLGRWGAALRSR